MLRSFVILCLCSCLAFAAMAEDASLVSSENDFSSPLDDSQSQPLFEGLKPHDSVENLELSDIPLDNLGLNTDNSILLNMFNGMDFDTIYQSLSQLQLLSSSPLLHKLKVRLLTSGTNVRTTDHQNHTLLNLRLQQLMLMGEFNIVDELLKHIPANRSNSTVEQLRTEFLFLQTRYTDGCIIVERQLALNTEGTFWRYAAIACALNQNDPEKAQLAFSLLQEEQLVPSGLVGTVMEQAINGTQKPVILTPLASRSPLILAFADIAHIPVTTAELKQFSPAALALLSSSLTTDAAIKIQAAELLLGTGNYPPSSLLALYQSVKNPSAGNASKSKAKANLRSDPTMLRSQNAIELALQNTPLLILKSIGKVYDGFYLADLPFQGIIYTANRGFDLDVPGTIPTESLPAAVAVLRSLIWHQKDAQTNRWIDQIVQRPLVGPIAIVFAKLRIGIQAIQLPENDIISSDTLTSWKQYATSIPANERNYFLHFIFALLEALKIQVPADVATSVMPSSSESYSHDLSLVKGLDKDFSRNYPAKTLLLAIGILEHQPIAKDQPLLMCSIVKALYEIGLKNEAIDLARIAIIYASQHTLSNYTPRT